jgi:hypothetical protein
MVRDPSFELSISSITLSNILKVLNVDLGGKFELGMKLNPT